MSRLYGLRKHEQSEHLSAMSEVNLDRQAGLCVRHMQLTSATRMFDLDTWAPIGVMTMKLVGAYGVGRDLERWGACGSISTVEYE
jgi:hypothetical protein